MAVAIIFARGGSKGLPGKNLLKLNNKPLIAWSIEQALSIKRISRVVVSTDSTEIAETAAMYGAEVPFLRPNELSTDDSSEWDAWKHALMFLQKTANGLPDTIVSLPPTSPLREVIDIENCLDEFEKGDSDVVVTIARSHSNPYFNMVKKDKNGYIKIVLPGKSNINQRQNAPEVFDILTVCYVANTNFVLSSNSILDGRIKAVEVPLERSIDIDTDFDFKLASAIFEMRKK